MTDKPFLYVQYINKDNEIFEEHSIHIRDGEIHPDKYTLTYLKEYKENKNKKEIAVNE